MQLTKLWLKVDLDHACLRVSADAEDGEVLPSNEDIQQLFNDQFNRNDVLKWQYFGSEDGLLVVYPGSVQDTCDEYDPRYRYVIVFMF